MKHDFVSPPGAYRARIKTGKSFGPGIGFAKLAADMAGVPYRPATMTGTSEYPRHLLDGRRVLWFTIATGLLAQAKALGREDWT
jgi:hypothetical protein